MTQSTQEQATFARVRAYVQTFFPDIEPISFAQSTANSVLAAEAVGVEVGAIAKTICFLIKDEPVLVVTSGDVRVDTKKLKEASGGKAKFVDPEKALEITGYPAGGVCPFDLPNPIKIYIDESLKRFPVVYTAAGTASSALPVTVEQLVQITGGQLMDLTQY